jgi:hypothetical protein
MPLLPGERQNPFPVSHCCEAVDASNSAYSKDDFNRHLAQTARRIAGICVSRNNSVVPSIQISMPEVPDSGKHHRQPKLIGGGDYLVVAH